MPISQDEFEQLLNDESKSIAGDIAWQEDEDHSTTVEFRAEIISDAGYPIFLKGSYNRQIHALTYAVISRTDGRIYALDLGKDHRNADTGQLIGRKHKHRWTEEYRDQVAYVPPDITAPATSPSGVWSQFCVEAKISHQGQMLPIPTYQPSIF